MTYTKKRIYIYIYIYICSPYFHQSFTGTPPLGPWRRDLERSRSCAPAGANA